MNDIVSWYPGFFDQHDYLAITEIVKLLPDQGTLVEIGTLFGKSAVCWASIFKQFGKTYHIYTLDCFRMTNKNFISKINIMGGDAKLIRPFIMADMNHEEMTRHLLKDYANITVLNYDIFENNPSQYNIENIDCIFQDANHASLGVRRTFTDWYPLLVNDGIYSGHDYTNENFPEVKYEVDLFAQEHNVSVITPCHESSVYYIQKQGF